IAIPTTYAGSEMTPIYGLTEGGLKKTGRDARVLPKTVIYDPELTLTLPVGLSVTSGLNAIAHAAEGLYAHDGNPIIALMAEASDALARIARALGIGDGSPDHADSPKALQTLARGVGAPTSLREIGMPADGLDRAADLAVTTPYPNPRPLQRDALRALLQRA